MDLWQFTPLHEAASKNRVEVCSLLLSHGADPTLVNCHGKSAVDMAPTPELKERLTCEYIFLPTEHDYVFWGWVLYSRLYGGEMALNYLPNKKFSPKYFTIN